MNIIKNLVLASKYNIKCPYTMNAQFIVVHNTANDASAANEIAYMIRNNNQVSFHYAVDDKQIIQGIPENRNAWHAGDGGSGKGNRNGIAIEICYSKSGGDRFIEAEKLAARFIAFKLKEKGWGINKVKKHQDFANKYCPHRTLDMGWQRFLNMIKKELNGPTQSSTSNDLYRVRKSWGDSKSQIGAFKNINNAIKLCKENTGYKVYDNLGNVVYPVQTNTSTQTQKVWRDYINGQIVKDLQYELNKQFNAGLKVDGWFGQSTINVLVTVRKDARGNLARIIQRRLQVKGFKLRHGVDGIYGPDTVTKVKAFQRKHGLSIDGIVGRETWKALFRK